LVVASWVETLGRKACGFQGGKNGWVNWHDPEDFAFKGSCIVYNTTLKTSAIRRWFFKTKRFVKEF
jgi:hypothetical protein